MVIDRPIEAHEDTRKLFVQAMNSNQYVVRRGQPREDLVKGRITKVLDSSKLQGRKDLTMDDLMRRTLKDEIKRSRGYTQRWDDDTFEGFCKGQSPKQLRTLSQS